MRIVDDEGVLEIGNEMERRLMAGAFIISSLSIKNLLQIFSNLQGKMQFHCQK